MANGKGGLRTRDIGCIQGIFFLLVWCLQNEPASQFKGASYGMAAGRFVGNRSAKDRY